MDGLMKKPHLRRYAQSSSLDVVITTPRGCGFASLAADTF